MKLYDKVSINLLTIMMCLMCGQAYATQSIQSQEDMISHHLRENQYDQVIFNKNDNEHIEKKSNVKFFVSKIYVNENQSINAHKKAKLINILKKYENRNLSLSDIDSIVKDINFYYRTHGYPAATAYVPEQKILDGKFQINVELGSFGNVVVDNKSKMTEKNLNSMISSIKHGETITGRKIETVIYNINDIPGVKAGGFMKPGGNLGETDIVIRVNDSKREGYSLYTENYGSKNSGRYRYIVAGEWNNFSGVGERIAANALVSNRRQHNYSLQYERPIAKNGTKLAVLANKGDYELGSRYSSMGATGRSTNVGISFITPLWKTSTSSMSLNYGWTYRKLKDELRIFDYTVEKHTNSGYLGISGHEQLRKTILNYDVSCTAGKLSVDEAKVSNTPLDIATRGKYTKGVAAISINHRIDDYFNFSIRGEMQKASNVLDSSEQFYLGGARGVRAYPQGEGNGDEGYQLTAEISYRTKVKGLSLASFFDLGHINYSADNSYNGGTTLKGWGLGIIYVNKSFWSRVDCARRIGLAENATESAKAKERLWFNTGINF